MLLAVAMQGQLTREEDVKAALLISFARFTEWPDEGHVGQPVVIGIVGQEELQQSALKLAVGKTIHGRPIQVRSVRHAADVKLCQVVHFGTLQGKKLEELIQPAGDNAVLTMGESVRFLDAGGAVYVFQQDGRLSFEVSMRVLEQAKLTVSSKLLRLGYVRDQERRVKR